MAGVHEWAAGTQQVEAPGAVLGSSPSGMHGGGVYSGPAVGMLGEDPHDTRIGHHGGATQGMPRIGSCESLCDEMSGLEKGMSAHRIMSSQSLTMRHNTSSQSLDNMEVMPWDMEEDLYVPNDSEQPSWKQNSRRKSRLVSKWKGSSTKGITKARSFDDLSAHKGIIKVRSCDDLTAVVEEKGEGQEEDFVEYECGYCAVRKVSSSSGSDGRVRIRCECGGKHADGKARMHARWRPTGSGQAQKELKKRMRKQLRAPDTISDSVGEVSVCTGGASFGGTSPPHSSTNSEGYRYNDGMTHDGTYNFDDNVHGEVDLLGIELAL